MTIRRLLLLLSLAVFAVPTGQACAQGAFPAPLPGPIPNDPAFPPVNGAAQTAPDPAFPPVNGAARTAPDPAFPPVNGAGPTASVGAPPTSFPVTGAAPVASAGFERPQAPPQQSAVVDRCMKAFLPMREEAEKRGKLIKVASERHASPVEACKLIKNFGQAEVKMMTYVETHSAQCGIPPQVSEQLKAGHKNTEKMQQTVCEAAEQQQRGPAGPTLSEVLGSASLPEATTTKNRASTFDTLNGNVLTR